MRKPLAVVLGVTAAVLIAGGIAATTAGADTGPDEPAVPALDLPGMPELPQLPGHEAPALPALPNQAADQHDPLADQQDPPADQQAAPARERPASDDRPGSDAHAQRPGSVSRGSASDSGTPAAAAGDQGGSGPAANSSSLAASVRQDVSPASVSTNPSAPVQQQVLALVNQNRRRGGCGDLTLDRRLIEAANDHASDMARRNYFAHESPNGDGSGDRMREAGYDWSRYGENIARGQESVYEVVDGWMHSPEHRENIMDCRLRQMGIGLAFSRDRTPYWVQDFATPQ